ncbi:DUF6457 domain-containing protein [Agromyces sp. Leaf222]|uniref:DUF6457 domain-containing protein n=1 Tax=Agromyces sp. Leaf222 TaxID=1735688 RepID=UPI0006F3B89F|nr:DUF6457 domain-containing protein [Agromyces sp. Leaf222]KQM81149.1 hypothetical protein ASE68_15120 [Agromyces sp. Leaf222]
MTPDAPNPNPNPNPPAPADLDAWVAEIAAELGLDPADVPVGDILDLTRRVAHGVARPAGPVTAFMIGLAVGRGTATGTASEVADRIGTRADG